MANFDLFEALKKLNSDPTLFDEVAKNFFAQAKKDVTGSDINTVLSNLLYEELRLYDIRNKDLFKQLQEQVKAYVPLASLPEDEKQAISRVQYCLKESVLKRVLEEQQIELFAREKKEWREKLLHRLKADWQDDTAMVAAFNGCEVLTKNDAKYKMPNITELRQALREIDEGKNLVYKETAPKRTKSILLQEVGLESTEVDAMKRSEILISEFVIAKAVADTMAGSITVTGESPPKDSVESFYLYLNSKLEDDSESVEACHHDKIAFQGKLYRLALPFSYMILLKERLESVSDSTVKACVNEILQEVNNLIAVDMPKGLEEKLITILKLVEVAIREPELENITRCGDKSILIAVDSLKLSCQLRVLTGALMTMRLNAYAQAQSALLEASKLAIKEFRSLGDKIYEEVERLRIKDPDVSLTQLTRILQTATTAIKEQTFESGSACAALAAEVAPHSAGKAVGGLLLALGGLTTMVASTALALASFGVLSPLSIAGYSLGASMLAAGLAVAAGVVGLGAHVGGNLLFFKGGIYQKPIRALLEGLGELPGKKP